MIDKRTEKHILDRLNIFFINDTGIIETCTHLSRLFLFFFFLGTKQSR